MDLKNNPGKGNYNQCALQYRIFGGVGINGGLEAFKNLINV